MLQEICPIPLQVFWHENKTIYLSYRKEKGKLILRLHRLFEKAPTPVLEALIRYVVRGDKKAKSVVKQMAHLYFANVYQEPKQLESVGSTYNLQEILDRLKEKLIIPEVAIGWSDRRHRGKCHSITFGTYDKVGRQIRINPLLDDPSVPLYFVEYIVYHEMLHAVCPSQIGMSGRLQVHTTEFKRREKEFPDYEKALKWVKKSLTFFKKRKSNGRP